MSDASNLDKRQLEWVEGLGKLEDENRERIVRAMAISIRQTLQDLRVAYSKFGDSEGTENRYTIQRQTKLFKELLKSSEALLGPATLNQLDEIYRRDLNEAYEYGGEASNDLRSLVEGDQYKTSQVTKMPIAAQFAAGERLKAFWTKERAELRQKVTEATINALQRGKGWKGAQAQIADALRSSGQTILRQKDELSVTANKGIVMNLQQRADLIARTEMASAFVQGQMNQYRKNGYTHGRWSATGERSCPFCAAREGAIYRLEDIEGAIPAHPRCRCTVSPVLGEAVDRAMAAQDKAVGAAEYLDDAAWTGIRQQRINEFEKFTGKTLDAPKYARTPTNSEKFFKGPNAQAAAPVWFPSGQPTPNVEAANAAATKAAQGLAEAKLTAEESIAADVMADPRFKTDAQRIREMRARLKRAGLNPDQDFVELTAKAREKGALSKDAKAERRELNKQKEEAEKAAAAKAERDAKVAAKEKADKEAQRLKEEKAKATGEGKVIDSEAGPLRKRLETLKDRREAVNAERTEARDLQRLINEAQQRQMDALQEKGQAALKRMGIKSSLDNAKEKLANLKPGKAGEKFDIKQYDIDIANQNHSMKSLMKVGADVLRRAGVTMTEVKQPATGGYANLSTEELDYAKQQVARAKAQIEAYKKNSARSRKNIRTLKSNEEYAISRAQREFETGRISEDHLETRLRQIKENTAKAIKNEEDYLAQVPKRVAEWADKRDRAQRDLDKFNESNKDSAAQRVIDELVSTSPISRADAKKLVEEAAKTNRIEEGKKKDRLHKIKLKPVPSDIDLDHMIDAVHMYGTRSSMDVYGFKTDRAHAHNRGTNRATGEPALNPDGSRQVGYVNSGSGYGDFRGTQFHELGHHLEFQNTDFYRASRQFIDSRKESPDEKPTWLGGNYGRDEIGYKGKAYSRYVLKEYDRDRVKQADLYMPGAYKDQARKESFAWLNGTDYTGLHQKMGLATEVTSMGVEKLSSAYNLQRLAEQDSDHLLLAIGMVKVQQARARVGIERFDRAKDQSTQVATEQDVPDGVKGGGDTKAQAARLKKEIDDLEKALKRAETEVKAIDKTAEEATNESFALLKKMSALRSLEEINAEREQLEDSIMDLQIEISPLTIKKREVDKRIAELDEAIRQLEDSRK